MSNRGVAPLQRTNHQVAYPNLKRYLRSQPIPATSYNTCSSIDTTFQLSSNGKRRCYTPTERRLHTDVHHRAWQGLSRYISIHELPRASRDNERSSANNSDSNVIPPDTSKSPPSAPVRPKPHGGRPSMEHLQQQARAKLADLVKQQLEEQQRERLQPVTPKTPTPSSNNENSRTTTTTLNTVSNTASRTASKESTSSSFASDNSLLAVNNEQRKSQQQELQPTQGPHVQWSAATATAATGSASTGGSSTMTKGSDSAANNDDDTVSYDPQSDWATLKAELTQDLRRVGERWRRFLSRPLDTPSPSPWQQQQQQHLLQQQGQQEPQTSSSSVFSGAPHETSPPLHDTQMSAATSLVAAPAVTSSSSNNSSNDSSNNSNSTPPSVLSPNALTAPPSEAATASAASPTSNTTPTSTFHRTATPVCWLLLTALVGTFAVQWAPLVERLMAGGWPVGQELTMGLAVLLACPPSPLTFSWQADAITIVAGGWGCLMTSTLLHSGLISLGAACASLQETAPWLESLHGFMIMIISYSMAGLGASLGQMCVAGQTTGLAGLGAAVGMEAAVCVRYWRATGRPQPPSPACLVLLGVAGISAGYQPLVGAWGILGGLFGGAVSGVLAYDVLYCMRVVLALSILAGLALWNVVTWVPRVLWRAVVLVCTAVWGAAGALVAAVRAL